MRTQGNCAWDLWVLQNQYDGGKERSLFQIRRTIAGKVRNNAKSIQRKHEGPGNRSIKDRSIKGGRLEVGTAEQLLLTYRMTGDQVSFN